MKRALLVAALVLLAGCGTNDPPAPGGAWQDTGRAWVRPITVDGVPCIVATKTGDHAVAISCDWSKR